MVMAISISIEKKGPQAVSQRSYISRQNDVYMMTLRREVTLNRHHLLLGHLFGHFQVVQQNPACLGQVGVVFRLGFVRLGRQRVFIFFLQFLEWVFALGLAADVLQYKLLILDVGVLLAAIDFVEADGFFFHQLLRQGQLVADKHELGILGGAGVVVSLQLRQERFERVR